MRDEPAAVAVTDLVVRHGSTVAVDGVSFSLSRGELLALLGPNGAGKTSTVEVCEGYRKPTDGTVRILGADPVEHRYGLMPHVGVMLQSGGVYPQARAGEILRLMASFSAEPLDVDALAARLGLDRVLRTPYRGLSGGEKQRLSLAMAIVGRPRVVFLDEPTAGMDPQARYETWALIEELRAAGVSILLTTHFLDEAERLSDVVVILSDGRVVATGTPTELTAVAGIDRVYATTRPGLPLDSLRATLPVDVRVEESHPGTYRLGGVDPDGLGETVTALTRWCAAHGADLTGLHTQRRTLEDVFLTLTNGSGQS